MKILKKLIQLKLLAMTTVIGLSTFQQTQAANMQELLACENLNWSSSAENKELERSLQTIKVKHIDMNGKEFEVSRQYMIEHSEPGLAKSKFKRVVFLFHGGMGTACNQADSTRLYSLTREQRRIKGSIPTVFIYPTGLVNKKDKVKGKSFNNGDPFSDEHYPQANGHYLADHRVKGATKIIEAKMVKAIVDELVNKKGYAVNKWRVYTGGHSNGGTLQWKLTKDLNGKNGMPKVHGTFISAGLIPKNVYNTYGIRNTFFSLMHGQHDTLACPNGSDTQFSINKTVEILANLYGYPAADVIEDNNDNSFTDDRGQTHYPKSGDLFANRVNDTRLMIESKKTLSPFRFFKIRDRSLPIMDCKNPVQKSGNIGAGHCWHGSGQKATNGDGCAKMFPATKIMLQMFSNFDQMDPY